MSDCCSVREPERKAPEHCPECGRAGREVGRMTLRALLKPEALALLSAPEHRFCPTPSCSAVYFGLGEVFRRDDILVPVFQKEAAGDRTVCYCFAVSEGDIRREIESAGASTAADRIAALVKAGHCACELRNPQGSCCLGHVRAVARAALKA